LDAVHHVVHDFAILVASGDLIKTFHEPPINSLIQDTFLMSCRKFGAFFSNRGRTNEMLVNDFLSTPQNFDVPLWTETWCKPMNRQLLHLSFERIRGSLSWDGSANRELLEQFRTAWRKFLEALEEPFFSEFARQIAAKKKGEFNKYL
jgi:hypothetical protein